MCLIAFVPEGKRLPEQHLVDAYDGNSDGIGVMSTMGVEKFVGRKALKRARRYLRSIHEAGIEHAIHFRYATHGDITRANCHPHRLPNGNGWMMHNGVLAGYAAHATAQFSDTALYAATHTSAAASGENFLEYWTQQASDIGSNKLCVMLPSGKFILVNGKLGTWIDDIWYSQTYSIDDSYGNWSYGAGSSRWAGYARTYKQTAADYDDEERYSVYNPVTGQFEPKLYDPSADKLRLAYDRQDGTMSRAMSDTNPSGSSEWAAWERDKYGNDPLPEDEALDAELERYIIRAEDVGCCTLCGQHETLDSDLLCYTCAKELQTDDSEQMLPNWSGNAARVMA